MEFDVAQALAALPGGAKKSSTKPSKEKRETTSPSSSSSDLSPPGQGSSSSSSDPALLVKPTDTAESAKKEHVALDRDILLHTSSKDFEEYMTQLSKQRPLSTAEQRQLKAQRRLISNRESAQASRKRKKAYLEEMEQKVADSNLRIQQLMANNAVLSAQVSDLTQEVKVLTEKLESRESKEEEEIFETKPNSTSS